MQPVALPTSQSTAPLSAHAAAVEHFDATVPPPLLLFTMQQTLLTPGHWSELVHASCTGGLPPLVGHPLVWQVPTKVFPPPLREMQHKLFASQVPPFGAPGHTSGPGAASGPASIAPPSLVVPPSTSPPSPDAVNVGDPHAVRRTTAPAIARRENAILGE